MLFVIALANLTFYPPKKVADFLHERKEDKNQHLCTYLWCHLEESRKNSRTWFGQVVLVFEQAKDAGLSFVE
jgi:hypothetical protein